MNRRRSSLLRWAFWLVAAVAGFFSWWQILWPPVSFYSRAKSDPGLAAVVGELLKPRNTIYDEPLLGWVFLALSVVLALVLIHCVRSVADYLQHSRVGISVLETVMEVEMQDAARDMAVIRRRQTIHANRKGITAYRFGSSTDTPGGRIVRSALSHQSTVGNKNITKELISRGSDTSLDIIEVFNRELPTSLLTTFLPNILVCALHKLGLFEGTVVVRQGESTFQNEFSQSQGVYSVSTTKYPISRTIIRVAFVLGHQPATDKIRGFLIRENVVEEIALSSNSTQTHFVYEARANSLHMESLRVQWEF
ncbi:hypothetical protein [Brevundimonas sp.]|uniref:hypothetical protein n=1 Tax=Brevundimonas sp. TaxID=1871086 RepID=UPI00289C29BF|nr:hypothetical protein [Brevundimonas sp.]